MPTRTTFPVFEKPPVAEVVLGMQFSPLTTLRVAHYGLLWTRFRGDFTRAEEQPPLAHFVETFGKPQGPSLEVRIETIPPVPRCWFLNKEGTELIQVQQDRFVHNWRKLATDAAYPRYAALRETFAKNLNAFREFVDDEKLGEIVADQCELTYINHIEQSGIWMRHSEIEKVMRLWNAGPREAGQPENVRFEVKYIISDGKDMPIGRLNVQLIPAFRRADGQPIFVMESIARGSPMGEGTDGVLAFLDLAHERQIRTFIAVTTDEMHKAWRMRNA
ncbi:MAG: TIGR04255 family protein [Planctomycetes bacterium]|nr:TIGR04255 family protein [Planctomycetota bacterium]